MVFEVLNISGFQKHTDYIDKLAVLDFPFKQPDKRIMVDVVETSADVAFNKPLYALESELDAG